MKAKLIIFDFDGTLADTAEGIVFSFQHALKKFGISGIADEKIRSLIGVPLEEMFRTLVPEEKKKEVDALAAEYRAHHSKNAQKTTKLFPHVKETLSEFKKRGKKIAIATTKKRDYMDLLLELLEIKKLFDITLCAQDVKNQKPDPEMILLALEKTGAKNTEAVMIGDTKLDTLAAKAAGVKSIGVSYGIGTVKELKETGAELIIDDFKELLEIIE